MKILVLNCGSSSIKYALYNMDDKSVITSGGIEKIGLPDSFINVKLNGEKAQDGRTPSRAYRRCAVSSSKVLTEGEYAVLKSLEELDAVGHRMVHGGEKFNKSVRLTPEVMEAFAACNDLAPLHNPANIKGVNAVKALLPDIPQVGVFDTAFHQTMPDYAYMYALPYELYKKYGVRRYGFHGTSHRYVSQRVCEFLGCKPEDKRIITCHIGNGASIAAVKDGKCVDTSMGLTPLEGLIMGTRSGDIDAGAVTFLMDKLNLDTKGISNLLNKKSGLAGVSEGAATSATSWQASQLATTRLVWPRRCTPIASRSTSVPMPPQWVVWTSSSSPAALARTSGRCAKVPRRAWSTWVSRWTRRRTAPAAPRRLCSLPTTPR